MTKTTFMQKKENVKREWYVVDASGKALGRLASKIASVLRGKHKAEYTPHVDCGDYVIVVNSKKVWISGRKQDQKIYQNYSGYSGGLKELTFKEMIARRPNDIIKRAVRGMLPKGRLGRAMLKKLKVFEAEEHGYIAQKPKILEV